MFVGGVRPPRTPFLPYFLNMPEQILKLIKKILFSLPAPVSPRPEHDGPGKPEVEGQTKNIHYPLIAFHSGLRSLYSLFVLIFLTAACAPPAAPTLETQVVNVYATSATQPWLADVFACAPPATVIRVADLPAEADISLHLGESYLLATPAFQIDTEEVLVVTHRQSPVQNMTVDEVRELFAGGGDPAVQIWVYASGEDVQGVFEQAVMQGRSVTSLARLAIGPQQMSDTLNNELNTVGILPRHLKAGDSRFVYTIPEVPVLALVDSEPQGAIQAIIACLQK